MNQEKFDLVREAISESAKTDDERLIMSYRITPETNCLLCSHCLRCSIRRVSTEVNWLLIVVRQKAGKLTSCPSS